MADLNELKKSLELSIKEYGHINIVAKICGLRPSSLKKFLNHNNIANATLIKVINGLNLISPQNRTIESNDNITQSLMMIQEGRLKSQLTELVKKEGNIELLAARLGLRSSSLKKVLGDEEISSATKTKISESLNSGPPVNSLKIERILAIYEMYKTEKTLDKVGHKMNLTRERVRQLLCKGHEMGLFDYKSIHKPEIPSEKLIADIKQYGSMRAVAKVNNISPPYLKSLLKTNGISSEIYGEYLIEHRRMKCIDDFNSIVARLNKLPTTTEIQSTDEGRAIYNRIARYWGSIDNLRAHLNIPKPPQGNPKFKEVAKVAIARMQKMALIVRLHQLEMIKECFQGDTLTMSQIAKRIGFKIPRTNRLVKILIFQNQIVKEGAGRNNKYRLNEEREPI